MSETEYPKYPGCRVQLTGEDGNAFAIIGKVQGALRRHLGGSMEPGELEDELAAFYIEATSGDYDQLLQSCMRWVDVS